jgi:hypothetical protein
LLGVTLALLTVSGTADFSVAGSECKRVQGHLEESLVEQSDCTSPVDLCTIALMFGGLKGEAHFTASNIIGSADTPTTGVVFVIGDTTVVDARLGGMRGTLSIKNAAAFRTTGDGDLVDVQTITGGTGDFAGATGSLRINGNFVDPVGGTSSYEGMVCIQ